MNQLTYDEYFEQLNKEGLYKMISNMTEVPSMGEAQDASKRMLDSIIEHCGLSKAKIRKAKYALAKVTFHNINYLAFLYTINGSQVMLRATDLDTKKFYIPNEVWIASTMEETEEPKLLLVLSLTKGEKNELKTI
jgi:hypothetical protein